MSKKLGYILLENEPLKKYTSFKIGGCADLFVNVENIEQLKELLYLIKNENIPFFILGKGSNLLVSDDGFRGIVLSLKKDFKNISQEKNYLVCGSGISLSKMCIFAMKKNLSGLEFAWGIPGSCGGAVYMNAGAYGNEMSSVIHEVTHLTLDGNIETIKNNELGLSYRQSIYNKNNFIILSVKLELVPSSQEIIKKEMFENMSKRKSKQPLNYPNAGSIFKRPQKGYAAALIESAGLKGFSVGGAMVSPKHSGFIVNTGNSTAKDVSNLIKIIKEKVYLNSNINLECEIKTLGDIYV